MQDECRALIDKLRNDYGLSMARIGYECGVSQQYIDLVDKGKRPGGYELEKSLKYLLRECERGNVQPARKPYTWATGENVRGKPRRWSPPKKKVESEPTRGRASTVTPPQLTPAQARATAPKSQASPPERPTAQPVPPPRTTPEPRLSPICQGCGREDPSTKLYNGVWLCDRHAKARGYKGNAATFVPLPTQYASFGSLSGELSPGNTSPRVEPAEAPQAEEPPPDPATWVYPNLGSPKYWDYQMEKFCLACHKYAPTRQVRIANYTGTNTNLRFSILL